ncbi:MAG: hypothetical protein K0S32_2143 [Bacteroidetes bacterium]|jgi:hypothetical protein|nr:hypothetical protein [Bacteroidota bacterium]
MKQLFKITIIICAAYAGLSCVCNDSELSAALVKKSDLIFEGKLVSVDEVPVDVNGDNLLLKFYPVRIHKGKIKDTVFLKSKQGTCGFVERFTHRDQYIGIRFLMYSTKTNGLYGYNPCNNRRVMKSPLHPDPQISNPENKDAVGKQDSIYISELTKLMLLLNGIDKDGKGKK